MRTGYSTREKRIRELEDLRRRINYGIGLLEGRVAAVETAKSVFIPWNGRDVCMDATVNAGPISCGGTLTSVTWNLRDSADTTTLATQTGSTASFTGLDGTLGYKVQASKAGYHTRTSATVTPGCGGTSTASVSTWPTTISWTLHLRMNDVSFGYCSKSGVSVSATGDGSASGTTDGSGNVTLSIGTNSTSSTQTYTVVSTAPAGSGCAVLTSSSLSVDACSPSNPNLTLNPASGYLGVVCNYRYMPDTLTWTDDFGTCSVVNPGGSSVTWSGSYTYTSAHAIDSYLCGGVPDVGFDISSPVTVSVMLYRVNGSSACATSTYGIGRQLELSATTPATFCNPTMTRKWQPVSDNITIPGSTYDTASGLYDSTYTCPASLDFNYTVAGYSAVVPPDIFPGTFEETAVTVDVTGTIT